MKTGKQVFSIIKMGMPVFVALMLLLAVGCGGDSDGDNSNTDSGSVASNQAPSIVSVYLTGDSIYILENGISINVGTEYELNGTEVPILRDISGTIYADADISDPDGDILTTSYEYKIGESGTWTPIADGLNLRDIPTGENTIYIRAVTSDGDDSVELQGTFIVDENDVPAGTDDNTEYNITVGDDSPALPLNATDAEEDAITYDIYKDGAPYAEGVSGAYYSPAGLPVGTHVFTAVPMDTDTGLEYAIGMVVVSPVETNPPVVESVVFKSVVHLGLAGTEDHNLGSETVVRDISGMVEVVPNITDPDDNVVSKVVKYSTDDGNNWSEIAADMDGKYLVDFSTLGGETLLFSVSATDSTGLEGMLEDDVEIDLNDGFEITDDGDFDDDTTFQEWGYHVILDLPAYAEVDPREGDALLLSLYKDDSFVEEVTSGGTYTTPSNLDLGDHDYTVSGVDEYGAPAEDSDTATVNVWYDDDDDSGG